MTTAIAEPATKAAFMSRSPNQVLTRRQVYTTSDGLGRQKQLTYANWLAEQEALNVVRVREGKDPEPIDDTPWKVEFVNSEYTVPDRIEGHLVSEEGKAALIEWLRGHEKNGIPGPSGFWEVGKAPDEPQPSVIDQMTEIADAGAMGDLARLEAVKQLELDTHNREVILKAAETGIARLRQIDSEAGGVAGTHKGPDDAGPGSD